MLIIPSIDLLNAHVVRLVEGRRETAKMYSDRPAEVASRFVDGGARRIHVVDLDGAFTVERVNELAIRGIVDTGAEVQVGGGVRDLEVCRALKNDGVRYIVLGTAAVKDPDFAQEACRQWPGHIIFAVDARDGKVAVDGWVTQTNVDVLELARRAVDWGAAGILYTDISRDGTGVGPNVEATARLARALAPVPVMASGGIGSLDHIRALSTAGVPAAIVGSALYEEKLTVAEAIAAASEQPST
jgi:phosphoribosylformimino-5-aminoimidazole carboxamide ribotide isomerase